ncbi:MAG TPA: hypothetical protein VFJ98_07185 [Mycobacteriales bacterium]|nr:hypothetical protein [Mycobacteriales bacterium]
MSSRRVLGALLVSALPLIAACGAAEGSGTEQIQPRPYAAAADAGALHVRAVRILPTGAITTTAGDTTTLAYLTLSIVNTGSEADTLTNATLDGGSITPGGPTTSFRIDPQHTLQFGSPLLGDDGATLEISGLTTPLRVGTVVDVSMSFQHAGTVSMKVPVYDGEYVGTTATSAPIDTTGSYPTAPPASDESGE